MSASRRRFFRDLGVGGAGLLSTSFIIGRGREAMAFGAVEMQPPDDGGNVRISSNENARGPGRKTIQALHNAISPRVGRGYPPDYTGDLVGTIADLYKVGRDQVIVGTGSGPILEGATRAFSARSSSMCFVSRSDAMPAAAVSVLMLPRFQVLEIALRVSGWPMP